MAALLIAELTAERKLVILERTADTIPLTADEAADFILLKPLVTDDFAEAIELLIDEPTFLNPFETEDFIPVIDEDTLDFKLEKLELAFDVKLDIVLLAELAVEEKPEIALLAELTCPFIVAKLLSIETTADDKDLIFPPTNATATPIAVRATAPAVIPAAPATIATPAAANLAKLVASVPVGLEADVAAVPNLETPAAAITIPVPINVIAAPAITPAAPKAVSPAAATTAPEPNTTAPAPATVNPAPKAIIEALAATALTDNAKMATEADNPYVAIIGNDAPTIVSETPNSVIAAATTPTAIPKAAIATENKVTPTAAAVTATLAPNIATDNAAMPTAAINEAAPNAAMPTDSANIETLALSPYVAIIGN